MTILVIVFRLCQEAEENTEHRGDSHASRYRNAGNGSKEPRKKATRSENQEKSQNYVDDSIGENCQNIKYCNIGSTSTA